jgi:hypothetical protein
MKRPLVETALRTEFGDVQEDASFHDVGSVDRDLTYVPGFSEMRRARDQVAADVASGKLPRHQAKQIPLPVNLRWTRATTPKGAPDAMKQIGSGNLGYRAVHKDQIGKVPWLKSLPPGAVVQADGSIIKGDTILMVADGKDAARNAARKQAATRNMAQDATAAAGGLLSVGAGKAGLEPFVAKE